MPECNCDTINKYKMENETLKKELKEMEELNKKLIDYCNFSELELPEVPGPQVYSENTIYGMSIIKDKLVTDDIKFIYSNSRRI